MHANAKTGTGTPDLCAEFRSAMGRLASSVTLITTVDGDSSPHGLAATAFSSVSMDPASVLICVNRSASASPVIRKTKLFCVSLLQSEHEKISTIFSRSDMRGQRFVEGDWKAGIHGIRYLVDAQAAIFCEVAHEIEHGTHTIIVGNVIDVVLPDVQEPLVYVGGRYRRLETPTSIVRQ
ncbi:flavin reductase family protein [Cupriavidus sp. 30B13]|uniref:flavin reductase family protein n=1 Tax=Cupriavidus sp. 30B13 TaxID=3384241 RepID=UPI003B8F58CC